MRPLAGLALALALLAAAGCGGDDEPGTPLRLVVPDNNIRIEGSECSGAIPFRHVHRGTAYRIEALDGELLAEGELPSGVARNADPKIDWESDRMPTVCTMDFVPHTTIFGTPENTTTTQPLNVDVNGEEIVVPVK